MGTHSQLGSREIIVGTGLTSPSETTLAAFKETASAGEIGVFAKDGTTLSAGDDFVIAVKLADSIIVSDVIKADTVKVRAKAYTPEQQGVLEFSNITVPSTTGATAEYFVNLVIYGFAGSTSVLDQYTKLGHYVFTQNGSGTAETVVDGLVSNLNASFSKEAGATATTNPLFTFSKGYTTVTLDVDTAPTADASATVTINGTDIAVALLNADTDAGAATKIAAAIDGTSGFSASAVGTVVTITVDSGASAAVSYAAGTTGTTVTIAGNAATAALIITGKEQVAQLSPYKNGAPISFDATFKPDSGYTYTKTVVQSPNPGIGTGKEVADLEFFFRGARGDHYRGVGFPYTWSTSTKTLASTATNYDIIELDHSITGGEFNVIKMPKSVIIACPTNATNDVADNVIDRIEVATGLTISALS